jgi:hypothetical protein
LLNKIKKFVSSAYCDKYGLWFIYKGEEVAYVWPWDAFRRQKFDNRFYSTGLGDWFPSLKEMDKAWADNLEEWMIRNNVNMGDKIC